MTTPGERTRAVLETGLFLQRLMSASDIPGVPDEIRRHAQWLQRHYPTLGNLQSAHIALPHLYAPIVESKRARLAPFHRLAAAATACLTVLRGRRAAAGDGVSPARELEASVASTLALIQSPVFAAIADELEAKMPRDAFFSRTARPRDVHATVDGPGDIDGRLAAKDGLPNELPHLR